MKPVLFALVAATLTGGIAAAQPSPSNPATTIICLDVSGRSRPAVCRVPASRIDQSEFICHCQLGMPVTVAICPPQVAPPPESRALESARHAAVRRGSLLGATFKGRPICVAPRNP